MDQFKNPNKANGRQRKQTPSKGKLFADIMMELENSIVPVDNERWTDGREARERTETFEEGTNVSDPCGSKKYRHSKKNCNAASSGAATPLHSLIFRAMTRLLLQFGYTLKDFLRGVERWAVSIVRCSAIEGSGSGHESDRGNEISDHVDEESLSATGEAVGDTKNHKNYHESDDAERISTKAADNKVLATAFTNSSAHVNSSTSPSTIFASAQCTLGADNCFTKTQQFSIRQFKPRNFRLPLLFPITKGGNKYPGMLVKIVIQEDYELELALEPFIFRYLSPTNEYKTGISLFKCRHY